MLIDIDGNPKKIPKKTTKKTQRLSSEAFLKAFEALVAANTENYCFFYCRDNELFKYSNCNTEEIDAFIQLHKREAIEDMIYDCLGPIFEDEVVEDFTFFEQPENEVLQDWIETFIKKMIEENKHDED